MTARQIRERITAVDRRLEELTAWEQKLVKARARYLVDPPDQARWVLSVIDHGVSGGEGTPTDPDLDGFERGLPGLRDTRETIARLNEERVLLAEQLPTKAVTDATMREADAQASDIRSSHDALAQRVVGLERALADLAALALDVAIDTHRLSEANSALDKLTKDGDIDRPITPRVEAPRVAVAMPLASIVGRHFRGGVAYPVDPQVAQQVRAALRKHAIVS